MMTAVVVVGLWATANAGSILEYNLWLPPGSALFLPLFVFGVWSLVEQRAATRRGREPSVAHQA